MIRVMLRCSKRKLWRLVSDQWKEPPTSVEDCFMEVESQPKTYTLHWTGGMARLAVIQGRPVLTVTDQGRQMPHLLNVKMLEERGMVRPYVEEFEGQASSDLRSSELGLCGNISGCIFDGIGHLFAKIKAQATEATVNLSREATSHI